MALDKSILRWCKGQDRKHGSKVHLQYGFEFTAKISSKSKSNCCVLCVQEIVTLSYYMKWVTTSWTYSRIITQVQQGLPRTLRACRQIFTPLPPKQIPLESAPLWIIPYYCCSMYVHLQLYFLSKKQRPLYFLSKTGNQIEIAPFTWTMIFGYSVTP